MTLARKKAVSTFGLAGRLWREKVTRRRADAWLTHGLNAVVVSGLKNAIARARARDWYPRHYPRAGVTRYSVDMPVDCPTDLDLPEIGVQ